MLRTYIPHLTLSQHIFVSITCQSRIDILYFHSLLDEGIRAEILHKVSNSIPLGIYLYIGFTYTAIIAITDDR